MKNYRLGYIRYLIREKLQILSIIWEEKYDILEALSNRIYRRGCKRAKDRFKVCKQCPSYSKNTTKRPFGKLPYNHCIECGCMTHLKIYSEENNCDLKKWKE